MLKSISGSKRCTIQHHKLSCKKIVSFSAAFLLIHAFGVKVVEITRKILSVGYSETFNKLTPFSGVIFLLDQFKLNLLAFSGQCFPSDGQNVLFLTKP